MSLRQRGFLKRMQRRKLKKHLKLKTKSSKFRKQKLLNKKRIKLMIFTKKWLRKTRNYKRSLWISNSTNKKILKKTRNCKRNSWIWNRMCRNFAELLISKLRVKTSPLWQNKYEELALLMIWIFFILSEYPFFIDGLK